MREAKEALFRKSLGKGSLSREFSAKKTSAPPTARRTQRKMLDVFSKRTFFYSNRSPAIKPIIRPMLVK